MQATAIPALGTIDGIQRKEPIYDTDYAPSGVALANQIVVFANYTAFAQATGTAPLSKAFGRDTNLSGGQGGLPQATRFSWYKWRCKIRSLDQNLNLAANQGWFEQANRLRQISFAIFQLSQTRYITTQLDELLGFTDSQFVSTVGTALAGTGGMVITPAVGDRQGRDITIKGEPYTLNPLETFNVLTVSPTQAAVLTPTLNMYVTHFLDGVLVRGITG